MFPNKRYKIILADPPWRYNDERSNDPHLGGITYPTMSDEEIYTLPIQDISDEDCMLFLWATMPKLKEALMTIERWGFRYITCAFVWVKKNPLGVGIYSGLGHWVNGNAELVLLGRKGSPERKRKDVKQIVIAARKEHSRKPAEVRNRIVELMGDLPRIELFARERMEGWEVWGFDAPKETQKILLKGGKSEI